MPVSISDHDLIYTVLKLKRQRPKPTFFTTRSFKKYQHEAFLRDISVIPWSVVDCFDEVNDSFMPSISYSTKYWTNIHLSEQSNCVADQTRTLFTLITDEIRELMKIRDYWRKLARRTGDPNIWTDRIQESEARS